MARTRQLGPSIDAQLEELSHDEQKEFIDSVERGWYELRSGLGEIVAENDDFFNSVRKLTARLFN